MKFHLLFTARFFILQLFVLPTALFFTSKANAQLCNGSLGDPVVNITFGAGNNPGPALPAAATSYRYVTNSCPLNGDYTLLNKGVDCNYGWHVLQSDHTGNPNGYFMLVDASFEPGDFYIDTVKNLCTNTTYEFAAWMLNLKYVAAGTRPNITFTIETLNGQVLQTYNSGDIPVEQKVVWKQYGFFFTTPAIVSDVVLRLTNNAPGGNGNDLALDDITFRPCGLLIAASVQGQPNNTIDICEGNTTTYTFNSTVAAGYVSPFYQWQLSANKGTTWNDITGANSFIYQQQASTPGNYWYRLAVVEANTTGTTSCSIASNLIKVNVHSKPIVDAGPDRNVLAGSAIILAAAIKGDSLGLQWNPNKFINDITFLTPTVSPIQDINYELSATSMYGCFSKDEVLVKVIKGIFIPTAFTPNGDGMNDTWKIPFLDAGYNATVSVYNRYGQSVYKATKKIISWDGTYHGMRQPAGMYIYMITFPSGNSVMRGTITLVK